MIAHRKFNNVPHACISQVSKKWVHTHTSQLATAHRNLQLATAHRNSQLAIAHRKSCLVTYLLNSWKVESFFFFSNFVDFSGFYLEKLESVKSYQKISQKFWSSSDSKRFYGLFNGSKNSKLSLKCYELMTLLCLYYLH